MLQGNSPQATSKTPKAQQSESFKIPKPVQHKVQNGSFKVPKPVPQSQQTKIVTLTQSSEQIRSTKVTRRDISNEQTKSIETGTKSRSILDRSSSRPRNDTITKE